VSIFFRHPMGQSSPFTNQHVFITGGSQGLGLHLAAEFARAGAKVTIVSRDPQHLSDALAFLGSSATERRPLTATTQAIPADVTDAEALQAAVDQATTTFGPIDVLVTCAGFAPTGYFTDLSVEQFQAAMGLNYFGTLHAVRAVVPAMRDRRRGRIVIVSSALALTGSVGYTAYCPSKWAVRGLGEALRNELLPSGIAVQQVFPPGMDTPGFEVENRTKPPETKAIEGNETTHRPERCAAAAFKAIAKGRYHITCGDFNVAMLGIGAAGMAPRCSYLLDALFLPFMVVIGLCVRRQWDREVCGPQYRHCAPIP
jgi:3-dehydrosphinganine reductase